MDVRGGRCSSGTPKHLLEGAVHLAAPGPFDHPCHPSDLDPCNRLRGLVVCAEVVGGVSTDTYLTTGTLDSVIGNLGHVVNNEPTIPAILAVVEVHDGVPGNAYSRMALCRSPATSGEAAAAPPPWGPVRLDLAPAASPEHVPRQCMAGLVRDGDRDLPLATESFAKTEGSAALRCGH